MGKSDFIYLKGILLGAGLTALGFVITTRVLNDNPTKSLQYNFVPSEDREIISRYDSNGDGLSVDEMSDLFKDYQLLERDSRTAIDDRINELTE